MKHVCLIHRILNERKRSNLHQDCLYLYKYKEIYIMYWVLFVVLLDLRQGLILLKSSLFSIIWQFVGHGGANFCLGGPAGGDGMWGGGGGGWWGCDPRVWGELATMLILANNLAWFDIFFLSIRSLLIRHEIIFVTHEYIWTAADTFKSDIFTLPVFSATLNIRKILTSIFPWRNIRDVWAGCSGRCSEYRPVVY